MDSNFINQLYGFLPWFVSLLGVTMVVLIVWIVFWFKARGKELQFHQDLRIKEMEHQRRMKELELEIEKVKAAQPVGRAA